MGSIAQNNVHEVFVDLCGLEDTGQKCLIHHLQFLTPTERNFSSLNVLSWMISVIS